MKKLALIALCLASIFYLMHKIQQANKLQHLDRCIDSNPTDTGCDSCFYAVYGYFDTGSYSSGHYNPEN